jgi:MFS family permease
VVLAYALYNLVYAAASIPAGRLSDRIGRRRVLMFGWTLQGLVYLGFGFATTGWHCFALMAAYGFAVACHEGVGKALIADTAPPARRGAALASVVTGLLWSAYGPGVALSLGLFTSLAASLTLPAPATSR